MEGIRTEALRPNARFTRRALLVGAAQTGLLSFLGLRLHDLQVTYANRYAVMAEENRISVQPIAPMRGNILDCTGLVLARSDENLQVSIIPDLAKDVAAGLDKLAQLVKITREDRERVLETAARQNRLVPILVTTGLTWEEFARINLLAPQLPGIEAEIGWNRVYSEGESTGLVVGYVGKADRPEVGTDQSLRLATMRIGKLGVELGMESLLRGKPGSVKREVDAKGRVVQELERTQAEPGSDLTLTIDAALQAKVLSRMRQEEEWASVVAIDVRSGEIAVMASTPTFDPAQIANGITPEAWQALQDAPGDPLTNKAIRGLYPPGSTLKVITALAGLECAAITPKTAFTCNGSLDYGGANFGCWKSGGHGTMHLHEAIRESCDVFFYETARLTGIEKLAEMARRFGLGSVAECGIAAQKTGIYPDPAWKMAVFERPWVGGETLLAGIGQGYVSTTPLQLALMTARIATGMALAPRLVRAALGEAPLPPPEALPVSVAALQAVRHGMWAAVNEDGGTGSSAALGISGVELAGKTGTAQVSRESRGRSSAELERGKRDHSLFIGFAPVDGPKFAIAAVVEHGGGGSKAAAPLARDVMAMLIEREAEMGPGSGQDARGGF